MRKTKRLKEREIGKQNQGKQARPFDSASHLPHALKRESQFGAKLRAFSLILVKKTDSLTDINILLDSGNQTTVIILSYSPHKNGNLGSTGHFPSNSNSVFIYVIPISVSKNLTSEFINSTQQF